MKLCYTRNSNVYDVYAVLHQSELRWFVETHANKCKNLRLACKNKFKGVTDPGLYDLNEYYGAVKTQTKMRVVPATKDKGVRIYVISAKGTQIFKWPESNTAWKSLFLVCYSAVLEGAIKDYAALNANFIRLNGELRQQIRAKTQAKTAKQGGKKGRKR